MSVSMDRTHRLGKRLKIREYFLIKSFSYRSIFKKKQTHFLIINVVLLINGVISLIIRDVLRINTDDLKIDEDNTKDLFATKNKIPSMRDDFN